MMGEVVGKAAAIAVKHNATPRDVYHLYWSEMDTLLKLPGRARRGLDGTFDISGAEPGPVDDTGGRGTPITAPITGLPGIVVDNQAAKLTGSWTPGANLDHVGPDYHYGRGAGTKAVFELTIPKDGRYEIRFATAPHENRASNTSVTVRSSEGDRKLSVNQKQPGKIANRWVSLGTFRFAVGKPAVVEVDAAGADGNVHIDAVQALPVE
jgi:hypothetical protein